MTLLDEIKAKCSPELLAGQDADAIAAAVNVGRTRIVPSLGGIGAVMETLGAVDGPLVLDALDSLENVDQKTIEQAILISELYGMSKDD